MKVFITQLDGTEVVIGNCASVCSVLDDIEVPGEDGPSRLHVTVGGGGVVKDVYTSREADFDHNIGSEATLIEQIVARLVEEGA